MPLVPASLQLKNSNQIQTTELRIKALGCGLIGVCREKYEKTPLPQPRRPPCAHSRSLPARHSFLTQAHNKREYAHVSGSAVKFDALSFHVNQRMTKHLSDIVSPRLAAILGKVPSRPQPAPSAPLLSTSPSICRAAFEKTTSVALALAPAVTPESASV